MLMLSKKQIQTILLFLIVIAAFFSIGYIAIVHSSLVAVIGGSIVITLLSLLAAGFILEFIRD